MSKVFTGMSGGVDSSVAAWLLKEQGHSVTGVTFTAAFEQGSRKCCSIRDIEDARKVCSFLGIPHRVIDLKDVFQARIISHFVDSYRRGLTPNPCVLCNRHVKFGALLEHALQEGAEFLATGHYASVERDGQTGEFLIRRGKDAAKDQSYFLACVEPEKLPHVILPLGDWTKTDIRKQAEKAGLPVHAHKPESQDICFVKDDYRDFLAAEGVKETPGEFFHNGRAVGIHKGIPFYSYGQRRGLSVALGQRLFVREFDPAANRIVLGEKPYVRDFTVEQPNLFRGDFRGGDYSVQVRYQSEILKCAVSRAEGVLSVSLEKPFGIVAPGQVAAFYDGDNLVAGGVISRARLIP